MQQPNSAPVLRPVNALNSFHECFPDDDDFVLDFDKSMDAALRYSLDDLDDPGLAPLDRVLPALADGPGLEGSVPDESGFYDWDSREALPPYAVSTPAPVSIVQLTSKAA